MTLKECPTAAMALSELANAKDDIMKKFSNLVKNGDPQNSSDQVYNEALKEARISFFLTK
jgi:hypothetical protein